MRRSLAAACLIFSLVSVQSVVADPSLKELAARTEVRPIETLTLTDQQFLTGDKSGKAAVIAGELRLPQGAAGASRRRAHAWFGGRRCARGVLVENLQRNGNRIVPGRQLLRARAHQRVPRTRRCLVAST